MDRPIDTELLAGFSFACQPGCGLCCYASPAVSVEEKERLLQIEPGLPFQSEDEPFALLPTRPGGGACVLLERERCRHHPERPFPCQAFPLLVHLGARAQASLVLSCPGVELAALDEWAAGPPPLHPAPVGLEAEWRAVLREAASVPWREWLEEARLAERRLVGDGNALAGTPVASRSPRDGPPAEGLRPPPIDSALEELPLTFDGSEGRLAIGSESDGSYVLEAINERGGVSRRIGRYARPDRLPQLTPSAERRLEGYRHYIVARDHFRWSAYLEVEDPRELGGRLEQNLREATDECLLRASVLARVHGAPGERLDVEEIDRGIRAVDAELLDRPTLGRIL